MPKTIGRTRNEVFHNLFDLMGFNFQNAHWKQWERSLKAYRKMGYVVERCALVPLTDLQKNVDI